MRYFKFTAETPYCGTTDIRVDKFNDNITEKELNSIAYDFAQENGESYEYLVFGYGANPVEDGEITQEDYNDEIDSYYNDCVGYWEEISEKEYNEMEGD